jgi:hypothetical protein
VIAALQTLGGTPTVTMKTTHKYYDGKPKTAPAPAAPAADPSKGAQLRPVVSHVTRNATLREPPSLRPGRMTGAEGMR